MCIRNSASFLEHFLVFNFSKDFSVKLRHLISSLTIISQLVGELEEMKIVKEKYENVQDLISALKHCVASGEKS